MSDISKLPRWAQQHIEILERDLAYWRGKAEAGPEESNTFVDGYTNSGRNGGTPLGMNTAVRFEVSERDYFLVEMDGTALRVHGTARGNSALAVLPRSNNVIEIELAS